MRRAGEWAWRGRGSSAAEAGAGWAGTERRWPEDDGTRSRQQLLAGGGPGREPHHRGLCAQPGRGHHPGQLVEAAARRLVHGPSPQTCVRCVAGAPGRHHLLRLQQRQSRVTLALLTETFVSTQLAILSARSLLQLWCAVRNVLHSPDCGWTLPCSRCGPVSTVVDCAQLASPRPVPGPGTEPVIRLTPVVITLHCSLPPAQHAPSPYFRTGCRWRSV